MNDQEFINNFVKPNSMCSKEQIKELSDALDKIFTNGIQGDIVECGTWRGGLACLIFKKITENAHAKKLFVYDTFEGMVRPGDVDVDTKGEDALSFFEKHYDKNSDTSNWCRAGIDVIISNLQRINKNYQEHVTLIKGKVEDTLIQAKNIPQSISLMRLDTDWYQSTKIELETFYPLLSQGGIIIVDDYGHWQGQKKAVDEFFTNISEDSIKRVVGSNYSLIIEKLI